MTDKQHLEPARGGREGGQPFERYPALASWIALLANTRGLPISLADWSEFIAALNLAITQAEALSPPPDTAPDDGWRPIESFPDQLPWRKLGPSETRHYDSALIYGPVWVGDWMQSPWQPERGGGFTGTPAIAMAHTYEGAPCWTLDSEGPSDYDTYIRPTHWRPLPPPPESSAVDGDREA